MKNQVRRFRALLISALFCAGALGSGNLAAQAGNGAKAPTEILFWYAYAGVVQENNTYLTKKFNETVGKEKGIHVTAEYQGGYAELNQKFQAASIAGKAPEVVVTEIGSVGAFAMNGLIDPVDELVARDKFDLSDFQKGLMGNSYVGGKLYSLPFLRSTPILYMNTTVLRKAGLDPAGPRTWDELASYCRTIKEKTGLFGMTIWSDVWVYEALLMQAGTTVLSDDEKSSNINSAAARDAVKFFNDLKNAGLIRIVASADVSKTTADIMNQKCGMWFQTTAGLTTYRGIAKSNNFEINTAFMPKGVRYGVPSGGSNLSISGKVDKRNKDAAWEFVKWMTATEQTAYASAFTGYMPSRRSAVESPAMKALYASTPQFKVAVDQMVYATKRPLNPGYTEAANVITKALDAAWVTGQDIDTLFADAEKRVNRLLNE